MSLIKMMNAGPIPTKILRNFMQLHVPQTIKISSTMVANMKERVKILQRKYGNDVDVIPGKESSCLIHPRILQQSPENVYHKPYLTNVYKEAMVEVLTGNISEKKLQSLK